MSTTIPFKLSPCRRKLAVILLGSLMTGLLNSSETLAQARLNDELLRLYQNDELLRQQQREDALRERLEERPDVRLQVPLETLDRFPEQESPCFVIQELHVKGEAIERFGWLQDAALGGSDEDSPLGKCLGTQGINLVLKRTQNALIDRGFVTSRVLVEPQDLGDGSLILTLVPGRIAHVRWADPNPTWASWRNALPARPGDILNLRDIEQALENFQHLPSVDVDIQIAPGGEPGESNLVIAYQQKRPLRASASLDNSGTDATGRYLAGVTLSYDNLLGLNDLAYISLSKDAGGGYPGPRGNKSRLAHYSIPWGYWRLRLDASDYAYHQSIAGPSETNEYSGTSRDLSATLSRTIYRDASRKTTVSAGAFQRQSHNFVNDSEIEVQRRVVGGWEAGIDHREFIGNSLVNVQLNYQRGTGAFGSLPAPEEVETDFGADSDIKGTSHFELITSTTDVSVPFLLGQQSLRYLGQMRFQYNLTPLTPLEQFSIGSRYTVRGFTDNTLTAERGWLVRNELEADVGRSGQSLYVGLDYGQVDGPSTKWLLGERLAGTALGVRGSLGNSRFQYDASIAAPLLKPDGFQTDDYDLALSLYVTL